MMVQSDLYIHGAEPQRMAIVKMVMRIAERIGIDTADESALNIPIGMVMAVLVGDPMHLGLLVGLKYRGPRVYGRACRAARCLCTRNAARCPARMF